MKSAIFGYLNVLPVLETKRLMLRQLLLRDRDDMYEYAKKPEVTKYLLWYEHESPAFTGRYLRYLQHKYRRGDYYEWAVVLKETGKMIGTCGFVQFDAENNSAEIGYVISDSFWGSGYAPEAVRCIIDFGFDNLQLNRIFARHMAGNDRSGRVMQKCGMVYEGVQRSAMYIKGQYKDIVQYAIIRSDQLHWRQSAP